MSPCAARPRPAYPAGATDNPHLVPLDKARDQPGPLRLLDEIAQKGGARGILPGVPIACCTAVNRPSKIRAPGICSQVGEEPRPEPGQRLQRLGPEFLYALAILSERTSWACLMLRSSHRP